MKFTIGFKLHWLEMIFVLLNIFMAGMFLVSDSESKFIYLGLTIFAAGIILIKKRIKMPLNAIKNK